MARINTLLLPDNKTSILLTQITRSTAYDNGVGIFNLRDRMIGWVPCPNEEIAAQIVEMIDDMLNNPHRAKKPDWAMLKTA